jgi:hypothetical protein
MFNQLHKKLIKQDQQLLNETNLNCPLTIQRKQLQKDIDDFDILNKRQDIRAIQQIIERIEHMSMFNQKCYLNPNKEFQSISCSYQVC